MLVQTFIYVMVLICIFIVIPVSIEMGQLGGWGGQQVVYPTMTTVINQSDNSQVQKVTASGQTQIQVQQLHHTPPHNSQIVKQYGKSPSKRTPLQTNTKMTTPGTGSGRKKRQWKSLVLRELFYRHHRLI